MKVLLDLQAAQAGATIPDQLDHPACNLVRGLLAEVDGGTEIHLLLTAALPEPALRLRRLFLAHIPAEQIHMIVPPDPETTQGQIHPAALLYETKVNSIAPDVIHYTDPLCSSLEPLLTAPLCSNPGLVATANVTCPAPSSFNRYQYKILLALKRADQIFCPKEVSHLLKTRYFFPEEQFTEVSALDQRGLARLLLQKWQQLLQQKSQSQIARQLPELAWISPLPPEQSGIADYSAELIPELSRYYEITLISDLPLLTSPHLAGVFPVQDIAWFEQNSNRFDRILYHIGNSSFHERQFRLLPQHPGTVVLHDCFISNIIAALGHATKDPGALTRRICLDHGYTPLARQLKPDELMEQYPCCLHIIKQSSGVIVHSAFSAGIIQQHYGPAVTPFLQQVPFLRLPAELPSRTEARQQLGIPLDAFMVCSFGFVGPTKLSHKLLAAWQQSALARDSRCRLVYVGGNHPGDYGRALQRSVDQAEQPDSIVITGFVNSWHYRCYLAAADLAVQLRESSRGETSAAVYDCLMAGLPLICNAHGSMAELPDDTVFKLVEQFQDSELTRLLETLHQAPGDCTQRSIQATAWLWQHHSPVLVAKSYQEAIEHFHHQMPNSQVRNLLKQLGTATDTEQQAAVKAVLPGNIHTPDQPQLLLDISAVAKHDLKTGIERVVRSLLKELLKEPPAGYRVEPVYHDDNGGYRYARCFTMNSLGYDDPLLQDEPVQAGSGDLFLGADLIIAALPQVADCLRGWQLHGVRISFIVYDLLPLQRPDCFPAHIEPAFRCWLEAVAMLSDQLICISQAVADDLKGYLQQQAIPHNPDLKISHFHLGADLDASLPTTGLPDNTPELLQRFNGHPTFLMVSTIEPRKGYIQALEAMELLWNQGVKANLVIVGKPGWMTEQLIERLDNHPEQGRQLFCLYSASDELLELVYQNSSCLLAASEGEGFGLPLIEAAQHGLPLIVRDIPVFREVAGDHATYFSGANAADLADVVTAWLELPSEQRISSAGMPWLSWQQSKQQLLGALGLI